MVAALSAAFQKDLRGEFKALNFPIDDQSFTNLLNPDGTSTLTLMFAGNGGGTVKSITPAITFTCGTGKCSTSFPVFTNLTLAALATNGIIFSGWSGACLGTGDCVISLDMSKDVTATFSAVTKGDVNGDKAINVFDALLVLQNAVGLYTPTDVNTFKAAADVAPVDNNGMPKGDGKVDVFDALAILRHAVGLDEWITSLPISVALDNPGTVYAQQQIASAKVVNYTLTNNSYPAIIDGSAPVTVAKTSLTSFAWITPALPDGSHNISITLGGQQSNIQFTSKQVPVPLSAADIISQVSPLLVAEINNDIAALSVTSGNDAIISWLQTLEANLNNIPAQVASLSLSDQQALAAILYPNFVSNRQVHSSKVSFNQVSQACLDSAAAFNTICDITITDIAIAYTGLAVGIKTIPLGPQGPVIGGIVAIFGAVNVWEDFKLLKQMASGSIYNCITKPIKDTLNSLNAALTQDIAKIKTSSEVALESSYASSTNSSLAFTDKKQAAFSISTDYELDNTTIPMKLAALQNVINSFPQSFIPSDIAAFFGNIKTTKTITSPATTYSIQSVSDSNIAPSKLIDANGNLLLTFTFNKLTATSTPVSFSFVLVDSRDGHTDTYSATLQPQTVDHIKVTSDKTTVNAHETATLTAIAYADSAEQIEVTRKPTDFDWSITPPTNGNSVTNGVFTAGSTAGQAKVTATYNKASNVQPGSVAVTVGNPFTGNWTGKRTPPNPYGWEGSADSFALSISSDNYVSSPYVYGAKVNIIDTVMTFHTQETVTCAGSVGTGTAIVNFDFTAHVTGSNMTGGCICTMQYSADWPCGNSGCSYLEFTFTLQKQ